MNILKELVSSFDRNTFNRKLIKDCSHNENVSIIGKLHILTKKTKDNKEYYLLTITDSTGKINTPAWGNTDLFKFLEVADSDKLVEVCGKVIVGKYGSNIEIENIAFIELEEDKTITDETNLLSIENLKKELNNRVESILNEPLRKVINYVLLNYLDLIAKSPYSEKTAYTYVGGLLHSMIDAYDIAKSIAESINCSFWNESTIINEDLLLTGAILSNVGKCKTLKINEIGIVEKTFEGQLDEDSIYSREITSNAINSVILDYEDALAEDTKRMLTELKHIVASVKGNTSWGALTTPRSKHAILLSHINNIVYTKGLFETLEKDKKSGEFTKAYDSGRNYYLGEILD